MSSSHIQATGHHTWATGNLHSGTEVFYHFGGICPTQPILGSWQLTLTPQVTHIQPHNPRLTLPESPYETVTVWVMTTEIPN